MMTLAQLLASTAQFRAGKPKNPTAMTKVQTLSAVPIGNYFVTEARFRPLTELDMPFHQCTIVWHNMEFAEYRDEEHTITVEMDPTKIVYMARPKISSTPVRVRCTCATFYFCSWYADAKHQVLAGSNMPAYIRRSAPPPYGRPYANPQGIVNVCKHIVDFCAYLQKKRVIIP